MKKCPYCAEEIRDEAIKCRFCGEYLKKKSKWRNCFFSCLATFMLSILAVFLLVSFSFSLFKFIFYRLFFTPPNMQPYYPIPFTGNGIEGILREFSAIFQALWERLRDFFYFGPQRYTF